MCGVNFTLFGCEEKILSNVHIVHCTAICSFGFDFSIILHLYTGWQTTLVEQDHVQFKTRMTMQRCMPGRGRSYHKWRGK